MNREADSTPDTFHIAFWNLQNLFDLEASPIAADLEFTPVNGWNRRAFEAKIRNLAEVIRLMFDGNGPDLLGICEIENQRLGNLLIDAIGREDYALAHVENPDIRGIDTSLIYSTRLFEPDLEKTRGHLVHLRYPTRDIFEVPLKVLSNDAELTVLVNHWPSRSGGVYETAPFRMTVASHCGRLVDANLKLPRKEYLQLTDSEVSLLDLNKRWDRNVLVMGDLNDEPWSRSVMDILGGGYSTDRIEEPIKLSHGSLPSFKSYSSKTAWLFNPMWSLMSAPDTGTLFHARSSQTMHLVDQFLLSRGLFYGSDGLKPVVNENGVPDVRVFAPDIMTTTKKRPRAFNRDTCTGYSDHFPITMSMQVLDTPSV